MTSETEALQSRKMYLLGLITKHSNEIKKINSRLAVLESMELEADLVQAEPKL